MLNYTRIPAPRVTIVDPQTGIVANEWFRFFNNLYTIAYSSTGSVTAGTYGSATAVPQITVDDFGGIVAVTNVPIAIDASQIVSGTIASARISGSYTGITGVGTLTVGTWNASTIGVGYGGTGQTSYTNGQLLIGNSTGNTLTKATLSAGTAIGISNGAGAITITNTLPDQTVVLNNGTGISVTGTYPNFTITNTSPSSGGTVTSVSGTGTVNGITLTGTVTSSGSLTLGGTLSGIGNSQLTNSTISGVALGGSLFNLTAGTGVSFSAGTTYNGSAAITINATGTGGTVTSVAALTLGTTGTDLSSTVANGTTTPVITLNVPTASAANRGALSAADWTTFNNKGSGTVTSVAASVPSFLSIAGSPITTSGTLAITLSGTALPTTSGGTGLTSFTANGVAYASSTSALTTGSALVFNGTNLGIGVTPSAWQSTRTVLQVGATGSFHNVTNNTFVGNNIYSDTSGVARYISTGVSQLFSQESDGGQKWYNAPSGTAGNAITFTQAMTLNANGDLGVGTASPNSASVNKAITINGAANSILELNYGGTRGGYVYSNSILTVLSAVQAGAYLAFNTVDTERMRLFSSGGVSIGNTTDPGAGLLSVTNGILAGATTTAGAANLTTRITGGIFTTVNGGGISLTSGVATTIITLTNTSASQTWIVSANLFGESSSSYACVAIVTLINNSVTAITPLVTGGLSALTVSGLNIQYRQSSGGTKTNNQWSAIRIM